MPSPRPGPCCAQPKSQYIFFVPPQNAPYPAPRNPQNAPKIPKKTPLKNAASLFKNLSAFLQNFGQNNICAQRSRTPRPPIKNARAITTILATRRPPGRSPAEKLYYEVFAVLSNRYRAPPEFFLIFFNFFPAPNFPPRIFHAKRTPK